MKPSSIRALFLGATALLAATSTNLAQAGDQVGIAFTNRLPNFTLNGQIASQGLSINSLFTSASFLSNLTAEISSTFCTLKHRQDAAVAAYDQAAATYKGAILSGFENVADSLVALDTDAAELRSAVAAERVAKHMLYIIIAQKQQGQVPELAVVSAEQSYAQAKLTRIQTQANRFADTAALFQALGGGWWNRTEISDRKSS